MYGLLLQVDPTLCTFVLSIRLRVTINWISEESIVNTCKMFTMRVNFLAASLPRIPGCMVLYLLFGFAMSSASILSLSNFIHQALAASAVHNSLKKTVRTLYFWYSFAQLE